MDMEIKTLAKVNLDTLIMDMVFWLSREELQEFILEIGKRVAELEFTARLALEFLRLVNEACE